MSDESDKQQIDGGSDGGGEERSNQKKQSGYGRKAKRVVLSRFRKAKKQLKIDKNKEKRPSSSVSKSSGRCCLYIKRIPKLDSSTGSPTSDPNSSEFTFDSLRSLIEKSDFLLNECNTHLDVQSSDDDDL